MKSVEVAANSQLECTELINDAIQIQLNRFHLSGEEGGLWTRLQNVTLYLFNLF